MSRRGKSIGMWAGAVGAAALLVLPAIATAKPDSRRPPAISLSFDRVGSFTPATADPKLAAAFANRGNTLTDFKFTPAAPKGRPSQVRVAIRARAETGARPSDGGTAAVGSLTPASYNLGVSVGWRRFALTGDVARTRVVPACTRWSRDCGWVNYSLGRRVTGRVAAVAERSEWYPGTAVVQEKAYALDVGGQWR